MDEGLMGVVAKLPLERNFKLEHVKEVNTLSSSAGPNQCSASWGSQNVPVPSPIRWQILRSLTDCMLLS